MGASEARAAMPMRAAAAEESTSALKEEDLLTDEKLTKIRKILSDPNFKGFSKVAAEPGSKMNEFKRIHMEYPKEQIFGEIKKLYGVGGGTSQSAAADVPEVPEPPGVPTYFSIGVFGLSVALLTAVTKFFPPVPVDLAAVTPSSHPIMVCAVMLISFSVGSGLTLAVLRLRRRRTLALNKEPLMAAFV